MSNGAYLQSKEGVDARKQEIDALTNHFNEAIEAIMDPGKAEREAQELETNPLFVRGKMGLEKAMWDYAAATEAAGQLQQQGL